MASCYGKQGMASVSPAQQERENAVRRYLPMRTKLKDDTPVDLDYFRDRSVGRVMRIFGCYILLCSYQHVLVGVNSEHEAGWRLLNNEIEEVSLLTVHARLTPSPCYDT